MRGGLRNSFTPRRQSPELIENSIPSLWSEAMLSDRIGIGRTPVPGIGAAAGDEVAAADAAEAVVEYAEYYTRSVIVGRPNI